MATIDERAERGSGKARVLHGEANGRARQGAQVIEMQRRRLLSAMVEVLDAHGYEGATVARICKRAGVSRRTFYDLFDDREDCFIAAFELAIDRVGAHVVSAIESQVPVPGKNPGARATNWRVRLRASLVALLGFFEVESNIARLCLVETLKGGPEALERRRAIVETLAAAVDEGRAKAKGADPPPLTAESLVGGAVSVIHTRLVGQDRGTLLDLVNPLMSMIVLPYLGPAAARKELEQPVPILHATPEGSSGDIHASSDPFRGLPIRVTFRTVRVLDTIATRPDASNREIGENADVADQGQMSKLLRRLEKAGLIENHGEGQARGESNAWRITEHGHSVLHALGSGDG